MAVGDPMFEFSLLCANATVDVQAGAVSLAGGTVYTWDEVTPVASGVNVLVTQAAGGRDLTNGVMMQRDTYTVAGTDASLARSDVRFKVVTAEAGYADLVGRYLMPTAGVPHSAGVGGLLPARINRSCTVQEIAANPGDEL